MPERWVDRNTVADIEELDTLLSEPTESAISAMGRITGDLLLLGAGGKMGPTLARMARRASDAAGVKRRIIAVSRFSDPQLPEQLHAWGIEPLCGNLLDPQVLAELPDAPNIVYMTGMKFGSTGQEARTWAMNALLPAHVADRFRDSRIVAFSTGNVYGLSPIRLGGSLEEDPLLPDGEYAMSCLGRERLLEFYSQAFGTTMTILRLNYANELRYGVLVDVAQKVLAGQAIDLSMGHFNAIWQGDANAMALASFDVVASPPRVLNLAGPELLSVRRVAEMFGQRFGTPPHFVGEESPDARLSNAQRSHRMFGYPRVGPIQMIDWIADWLARGCPTFAKPTHFGSRDGKF